MADKIMYSNKPLINAIKLKTDLTVSQYVGDLEEQNQQLKREIRVLWECFKRLKEDE